MHSVAKKEKTLKLANHKWPNKRHVRRLKGGSRSEIILALSFLANVIYF